MLFSIYLISNKYIAQISRRDIFVPNHVHAYSSCKTVDNRLVYTTLPHQVCKFYGPNSVACDSLDSQAIPDVLDLDTDDYYLLLRLI